MKFQFKNTFLFLLLIVFSCRTSINNKNTTTNQPILTDSVAGNTEVLSNLEDKKLFYTGAENTNAYLKLLKNKKVGVVTNQTGVVSKKEVYSPEVTHGKGIRTIYTSIVDVLLENKVNVQTIFAPEHGFRGTADAGELIKDGKDTKTGLPIISLYGNNKKPKPEQLKGLDVVIFDIQDVGVRFYTFISTLHYVMEACAENNIPLIILDRPNPNGTIVDGPILETETTSFVGMHPIPVLHGLTIGEYGKMINGEKWLKNGIQCNLTIIECGNYKRNMVYNLPIKPSPNLPNAQAVNLYASLCLFEGTNVSVGRGTEMQFQIFGSPFLPKTFVLKNHKGGDITKDHFSFTPKPNEGAKDPLYNGVMCYGEYLVQQPKTNQLEIKWLLYAYKKTADQKVFFNDFFTKLAGTKKLREQIEAGLTETEIRETWKTGLTEFKKMTAKYLIYK